MNSMTGYGEAQGEADGVNYAVEVKTVNNRYLKTMIKLPELASFLEEDIDKLLRKNIFRGTINYVLRLKDTSASALFDINEAALQAVLEKLSRAGSSTGINGVIDIGNLLTLPGIIQPALPGKERAVQIRKLVLEISQKALDKLKRMRATEGDYLETDIKKCCTIIEEGLEQVRGRSAIVIKEYADKLKKRVNELLAHAELKIDEGILAREVAIFAERSDISEEVARLDSHLQQFAQCCRGSDQAGRRLDFISQEMLREANTIASKASDTETTRYVVNIKCQIDRIKEQVQNIE
jgi:uncharacterized protein (TIGR00255 family)